MKIPFTKMHGIGNDFIILNQLSNKYNLNSNIIRSLSHRQFGIGFDQLLIIESSSNPKAEFKYRIFNSDGNEVEQCGNGARCFYYYIRNKKLSESARITVETKSGLIVLSESSKDLISVDMGKPIFKDKISDLFTYVSIGNPHAVLEPLGKDEKWEGALELGKEIQANSVLFPDGINIGMMKVIDKNNLKLKVLERGSGITLACGSGACAASAVAIQKGLVKTPVTVLMDGGNLIIDWDGLNSIIMSGPAKIVFEGELNLDLIKEYE
ncbi:diaminopimelate epimerase [Methylophilaceae bacterium]|jgi:diaminopimelate epimerase|nr:diaminopimelate epimerase [Methylophilaceae bacterium]|tara:strand:+ start:1824 stop:2624 length:801 start_codon:yes stop_codon:yes gene_type:complete